MAWVLAMAALLREAIHTRNERDAGRLDGATDVAAVASIEQRCEALLAAAVPAGCSR